MKTTNNRRKKGPRPLMTNSKKIPSHRELQILALTDAPRSGAEVAEHYFEYTKEEIPTGTLYVTYQNMEALGWVKITKPKNGDKRSKVFARTAAGKKALARGRDYYQSLAAFG